jgi:hypothetical protein
MKNEFKLKRNEMQRVSLSDDDAIMADLRRMQPDYYDAVDKLGVVLEELVKKLDLDGSGVEVYLLHYVADARQSLRSIVELLELPDLDT